MIRKVKDSLTAKIFLLVACLLLTASGITYTAIVGFLPVTYSNQLEENLNLMSQELAETIGDFRTVEDAGTAIELFEAAYQVSVVILDQWGECVWPRVETAVTAIEEDTGTAYNEVVIESDDVVTYENGKMWVTGENASAMKKYDLTVGGISYTMIVSGGMQPVNQAMEIIRRIFPVILCVSVTVAVLAALAAAFYLTAPVVNLSRISKKMAALDFKDTYQGRRTDEVGILGRNLNEMSENLSGTLKQLQQANAKLKSDIEMEREIEKKRIAFFAAVSHELKTPVTILKGHLSGMLSGVGEYRNRDYYLRRSQETVDKMEGMVQELLSVSRMESKRFTVEFADIAEQLRLELAQMTELIEEKRLGLELHIPEHLETNINVSMMEKIFRNLLTNAIRYTPAGGENEIRIYLEKNGDEICCEVENTGVFIPENDLPHLFEAFYRVEQSRNRQTGGSGLGLYIVKMALDLHGADYGIENTAEGVRCWFRFEEISTENT